MSLVRRADREEVPLQVGVVDAGLVASSPIEHNFADLYRKAHDIAMSDAEWFLEYDAAFDAVHEAALELFERWGKLLPEQKTVPAFRKAVRFRVIDQLRRNNKRV